MFKNTKEIINTLEVAIQLFDSPSALKRDKAKWMIVGSRHALQALTLEHILNKQQNTRVIEVNGHAKLSR